MRDFKWDIRELIEYVKERPCLWDKTTDNYKDRGERRVAWEEIFSLLEQNYEEMTPEEKRMTGETIINKWTNVRDTFVKTLKVSPGRPKRKYMLHNELKFLTKDRPESSVEYEDITMKKEIEIDSYTSKRSRRSDFDESRLTDNSEESYHSGKRQKYDYTLDVPSYTKKSKKRRTSEYLDDDKLNSINTIDFVGVDDQNEGRVMNEDEAFFASLLPTVVKYNEDERLEFRIEVLGVMKKLKEKRRWSDESNDLGS